LSGRVEVVRCRGVGAEDAGTGLENPGDCRQGEEERGGVDARVVGGAEGEGGLGEEAEVGGAGEGPAAAAAAAAAAAEEEEEEEEEEEINPFWRHEQEAMVASAERALALVKALNAHRAPWLERVRALGREGVLLRPAEPPPPEMAAMYRDRMSHFQVPFYTSSSYVCMDGLRVCPSEPRPVNPKP